MVNAVANIVGVGSNGSFSRKKNMYIALNGGDVDTLKADLTYKIYGDIDNYTSPIDVLGSGNTDSRVTVTGSFANLIGVNVGRNQYVKVSTVDASGNEAIPSNPWGSFYLEAGETEKVYCNLRKKIRIENDGDYIEFKFKYTSATFSGIFASIYYNARVIDLTSQNKIRVYNTDGVTLNFTPLTPGFINGSWQTLRITKISSTQCSTQFNGNAAVIENFDLGTLEFDTFFALSQESYSTENKFFKGYVEYVEINGDRLNFKHKGATHESENKTFALDVNSMSGTATSFLFTSLLSSTTPATGDPVIPNTPKIVRVTDYLGTAPYLLVLDFGQSLGDQTSGRAYRNPMAIGNAFQFDGGSNDYPDSSSFLTPLQKEDDSLVAMTDIMQKYGSYPKIVVGAPAEGGQTLTQLGPGSQWYINLIAHVTQLVRIADMEGSSVRVVAITFAHGEGDTHNDNWTYQSGVITLFNTLNSEIKPITGQVEDVFFPIYQMASHTQYHKYPFIPLAQLAISNSQPNIALVKAMYDGDYYGLGNVHGTTQLYSLMGAKFGWYIHHHVLQGNNWEKFQILSHILDVPNLKSTIVVKSAVLPMVFDTTEVVAQPDGNYGFKVINRYLDGGDNSLSTISVASVSITGVSIIGGNTFEITYDGNPTGSVLVYGMEGEGWLDITGTGNNVNLGRTVGPRGNIRDSQGDTVQLAIVDDTDVVQHNDLHNWMPIFEIEL